MPPNRRFLAGVAGTIFALAGVLVYLFLCAPSAEVLYEQAFACFKRAEFQEAQSLLRKVLDGKEDYAEAHNLLGCCQLKLHEPKKAISSFQAALRLDGDLAEAHRNLGVAYMHVGRAKEAIAAYQHALHLDPTDDLACFNLGVAYQRMGLLHHAKDAYAELLAAKPQSPAAQYNLGVVYLKLKRWQEARKAFQKVIEMNPSDAQARYNLVMCHARLGEKAAAIEQYRILKSLDRDLAAKLIAAVSEELGLSDSPTEASTPPDSESSIGHSEKRR